MTRCTILEERYTSQGDIFKLMEHLNAVILAGGSGTRLWPLSTPDFPKQFLPLPNGNSMIQETLARVEPLITTDRAWVVTGRSMVELVQEHLPTIPEQHILKEPIGRNTAAAIGCAADVFSRCRHARCRDAQTNGSPGL